MTDGLDASERDLAIWRRVERARWKRRHKPKGAAMNEPTGYETDRSIGQPTRLDVLGELSIEDLQRMLEAKQEQARAAKEQRRQQIENDLERLRDELDEVERELGYTRHGITSRVPHNQGLRRYKTKAQRGGITMGELAAKTLRQAGKPLKASEIAKLAGLPKNNISVYLKPFVERGQVTVTPIDNGMGGRPYDYEWVGGDL